MHNSLRHGYDKKTSAEEWKWQYGPAIWLVGALLVFSRRPDALLNAQFWAEDGVIWFRQAYEMGWPTLALPQNGYFQTVSKLTALISLFFPLAFVPLFFNMAALFFKLLPVALINSSRGRELVPATGWRLLLCFLYLAHPYSREVHANVTNIHWHLALSALIVVVFPAAKNRWGDAQDFLLVLLCGLSGTFSLFLAPLALWRCHSVRNRRQLLLASVLVIAAAVQCMAILTHPGTRSHAPLGATTELAAWIFSGQVVVAGLAGDLWSQLYASQAWRNAGFLAWALTLLGVAVFVRAWLVSNQALRCLIALGSMVLVAALAMPQISGTEPQWPLFAQPYTGGRYAFVPILAFYGCLAWLAAFDANRLFRHGSRLALACVLLVAVPASWKIRPYQDLEFKAHAARFEAAPPGSVVEIPINPQGWSFKLRKHDR
jgi:hypothetical protein